MANENGPGERDVGSPGAPSRPARQSRFLSQAKDVVLGFLPGPIKEILNKGLLKAFIYLVLIFVVLPPFLAFLAAFWLKELGTLNSGLARTVRAEILQTIQDGFSVEEVASRSNARLDYYQLIDVDLRPRIAPSKELRISLQPRQKTVIDVRVVRFIASDANCTLPEDQMELVSISLAGQPVRQLREYDAPSIVIGEKWWATQTTNDADDNWQALGFTLTDAVRRLPCGQVHVEGGVRVFKDILPATKEAQTR